MRSDGHEGEVTGVRRVGLEPGKGEESEEGASEVRSNFAREKPRDRLVCSDSYSSNKVARRLASDDIVI